MDKPHKYASLAKRNKLQENKYRAHNSKVVLQEIVLDIANFYKQFNEMYFPVRLDQKGRLYCSPHYFNYQANELSKSLLLFSKPRYVGRNDITAISYLKSHGANCLPHLQKLSLKYLSLRKAIYDILMSKAISILRLNTLKLSRSLILEITIKGLPKSLM